MNGTISFSAGALHGPESLSDTGALLTPAVSQQSKGKGWIILGSGAGLWQILWELHPLCPDSGTLSVQGPQVSKHLIYRPVPWKVGSTTEHRPGETMESPWRDHGETIERPWRDHAGHQLFLQSFSRLTCFTKTYKAPAQTHPNQTP